jgi:hypothetical protein
MPPVRQRARGRAEARRPVDGGAPADAAPLQDGDALVERLPAGRFLVEARIGLALAHVEFGAAGERPFLDHRDREPGLREDLGRDPAAGAAAHDDDVELELLVACRGGRVHHLPAARQPLPDRIGHGHRIRGAPG